MRPVVVTRRPDGIIQIRPRRAWRALTGPVPVAILALLLLSMLALAGLAMLLVRAPVLVLLAGGLAFLVLAAARYALQDRHTVLPAHASSHPRPPMDAA
jgi:hypothetical protein